MEEQGKLWGTEQEPPQEPTQEPAQEQGRTQGHVTRDDALKQLREVRELRKQLEGTGRYVLLPTEALTLRAEAYYNLYVEDVARLLVSSGITDTDTVEQVIHDYGYTLMGFYDLITLPLEKQAEIVNTVKPWKLYLTEQFGLNLLFGIYFYNVRTARDYIDNFKLANGNVFKVTKTKDGEQVEETKIPVEDEKRNYLSTVIYRIASGTAPMLAAAYRWIGKNKVKGDGGELLDIVELSDFAGIEPETINKYLAYVEAGAGIDYYVNYCYIAKYALHATPDELKEIDFPPIFVEFERAREYAERVGSQRYKNVQDKGAEVARMIAADTVEDIKKAQRDITKQPDTEPEQQDTIRIPETFALLGSRDVYASVDGTPQMAKGILPIQAFITDYMTRHNLTEQVTPRTVEKVIEGVNLLQRLHNVRPVGGFYTFKTNITEFSELIGFKDANQTQKMEIMRALQVLDGLYLAVWRSDGLKAVRVFTLQEIGLSGTYAGKLTLQVNADVMKGHPNLISFKDFDGMRKDAKGQAKNHFRSQIVAKGQKEENALLNEVFGYDVKLKNIETTGGTIEEIAKAKRVITNHKGRDKKNIAQWFAEYKAKGWIEWYTYTRNGKGEYIYKWKRGNIPKEQGVTPQEPDEQ